MRLFVTLPLLALLPVELRAQPPDASLAPWGANRHPSDVAKRYVGPIATGRHTCVARESGTINGTNWRAPMGVGMADGPAAQQTWGPNRAVRLENAGETDVLNPWLSNGRNRFRPAGEIVAAAVAPGMTGREKALALGLQQVRHRSHAAGDNAERMGPVEPSTSTATTPAAPIRSAWPACGARRGPG